MDVKTVLDAYYDATATVSFRCREFSFGGLALIWVLKAEQTISGINSDLLYAGFLLVASLAMDMFQYLYKAVIWGIYHHIKEKNITSNDKDFKAPNWFNYPTNFLFWIKVILLFMAYYFIGKYIQHLFT